MAFEYILDFIITAASILACVVISLIAKRSEKKTVDGFLLGGRSMSIIPTALSAFATIVSANNITSIVGETFANGMQFIILPMSFFVIQIPIAYFIIPVFHNMSYTSVYEYIEKRFDRSLRILISGIYLIISLFRNGIHLYVPAITVTTVTGVSYWITLVSAGLLCTLYCTIGGLKAVIWTDVFQSFLLFASVIMVTIAAFVEVGGVSNAWTTTFSGQVYQHFTVTEDLENNYSIWSIVFYAVACCFYTTIGSQACAQRFLCVKDYKAAKRTYLLSNALGVILHVIVFFTCVAVFGALSKCNPLLAANSKIHLPDQIYIFVASNLFKGVPGVLGIVLSGLLSAALSSVSSNINALSANVLEDFIMPLFPKLKKQERRRVILCRIFTLTFGILAILIGLGVPLMGGAIQVLLLVAGAFGGPICGIIFLAFFYRKTSIKACKLSLLVTFTLSVWLTIGSYKYYPHKPQFRHPVEQICPEDLAPSNLEFSESNNSTSNDVFPIERQGLAIYGICSFWIAPLSAALSTILGILFGLILAQEKSTDIRLLSPLVLTSEEKASILQMKTGEDEVFMLEPLKKQNSHADIKETLTPSV